MNYTNIRNRLIYVSALDWGWGHLSRTSAIIKNLSPNNTIVIFSTEHQSKFYTQLFPNIQQVLIPSYNINFYPSSFWKNIFSIPKFFKSIKKEKNFLHQYIEKNKAPDLIISDNRYGFYYERIKSVIICHQLELQVPPIFKFINRIHQNLLNKFDEIWIPDYEDEKISLGGKLSHTYSSLLNYKLRYILPHTLMKKYNDEKIIDYLFIISGTEAERNYYEKLFIDYAKLLLRKNQKIKIKIIGSMHKDNEVLLGWKNFEETNQLIIQSKNIITRAGYSTLMDIHFILTKEQNLFLIPSKYQYEQNYLYHYWIDKNLAKDINTTI